ncbi:MAG: hypothetical protein ACI8WB_001307 [Phenylobacterium sp.]|jgi:hypothetical protein
MVLPVKQQAYSGVLTVAQQTAFVADLKTRLQPWFSQWFGDRFGDEQTLSFERVEFNGQLFAAKQQQLSGQQIVLRDNALCCYLVDVSVDALPHTALDFFSRQAADQDHQLVAFVGQKMTAQLAEVLQISEVLPARTNDINQSYVCRIELILAGLSLVILVGAAYLQRFITLKQTTAEFTALYPALSLKQMVAQQTLTIPLTLAGEAVTVKQLLALQPGHVIPLKQQINQPLLAGPDEEQWRLAGHLVKSEGHKAMYLTGIEKQE